MVELSHYHRYTIKWLRNFKHVKRRVCDKTLFYPIPRRSKEICNNMTIMSIFKDCVFPKISGTKSLRVSQFCLSRDQVIKGFQFLEAHRV